MAMNLSQFQRFQRAADVTLAGLFPAVVRIAGIRYAASGVGGAAMLEFAPDGGGQVASGTRFFRIDKALLTTRPETGTLVEWLTDGANGPATETRLTLEDCPDRPHETSWLLRCVPVDR